jgi:hypothetical protein
MCAYLYPNHIFRFKMVLAGRRSELFGQSESLQLGGPTAMRVTCGPVLRLRIVRNVSQWCSNSLRGSKIGVLREKPVLHL